MHIKQLFALLLTAATIFSLAGCGLLDKDKSSKPSSSSAPPIEVDPNWPVTVGEITLEARPDAIVSLSPAMTELLFELGAGDRVVGVSSFCDYPNEVSELPSCGTSALPDREAIKAAKPQLVFASAPLTEQDTDWLSQQDIAVVVLRRVSSIDSLEERYLAAGTLLDGTVDGEKLGQKVYTSLREKYQAVVNAAKTIEKPYSGIWLREAPLLMATGDVFEGELLEALGVTNDAAEYTSWEYPPDKAADLYPDVVFYDKSIDPEYFGGTQIYSTTDAFKQNRMIAFDALVFERQSGRMFDELLRMFAEAYPDIPLNISPPSEPESDEPEESSSSLSGVIEEPKD